MDMFRYRVLILFILLIASLPSVAAAERYRFIPAEPQQVERIAPVTLAEPIYKVVPPALQTRLINILGQQRPASGNERGDVKRTEVFVGLSGTIERVTGLDLSGLSRLGSEACAVTFLKGNPSRLVVAANSDYGLSSGLQRLDEYVDNSNGNRTISISRLLDYPSFPIRGVIEGFYGRPWSEQERIEMLHFMGRTRLNYYFWAPKAVPSHRDEWRRPHSNEELASFRILLDKAESQKIHLVYGIAPGKSICYSSREDYNALLNKVKSVLHLGIFNIALLMDDISWELKNKNDKRSFGTLGKAQVALVQRLHADLKKLHPGIRLFFCPTKYFGTEPEKSDYLVTIGKGLPADMEIFWTGTRVYSPSITQADAVRIGNVLGRKPLYWDNFPVNDYISSRLHLGPLFNRQNGLERCSAGLVMNAMNQAEASKIALYTAASYLWNSKTYIAGTAWQKSLEEIGGTEALPFLEEIAVRLSGSAHWPEGYSRDLAARLDRLQNDYNAGNAEQAVFEADVWLACLLRNSARLRQSIDNRQLMDELSPLLERLEKAAHLCRQVLPLYLSTGKMDKQYQARIKEASVNMSDRPKLICPDIKTMENFIKETTIRFIRP